MIKLFFIPALIVLSCGSIKSNQADAKKDTVTATVSPAQTLNDSLPEQSPSSATQVNSTAGIPNCIKIKIDSFKVMQKHEQPQRVVEYMYKGKKVYYIVMPCCDFFSEVYDSACKFLGSPDGGITGKGDGKLPDFFNETSKEKLIWQATK